LWTSLRRSKTGNRGLVRLLPVVVGIGVLFTLVALAAWPAGARTIYGYDGGHKVAQECADAVFLSSTQRGSASVSSFALHGACSAVVAPVVGAETPSELTSSQLRAGIETADASTAANNAVFYSGRGNDVLAKDFAAKNGLTTIEDTPGGQWLAAQRLHERFTTEQADALWAQPSERYAQGAAGKINAFVQGAAPDRIWAKVEQPALEVNGIRGV
jgi:hypothetical protein